MSIESPDQCLDDAVLAAFADGTLKRSEIPAVLAHLRHCPNCMSALESANDVIGSTKGARPFRWWWIGAAAAVIAGMLLALPLLRRDESTVAKLRHYVSADARPVETRLTPFDWAPYRGPFRGSNPSDDARRLQLAGVAGDAVALADRDASADAQWTAGVALLVAGEPENAVKRLRTAAEAAPNDAAKWSDLAAALDVAAIRLQRSSLHAEALAAADHALAIDRSHRGALFNRALILEHLGLGSEARRAWDRYLMVDPSSSWANEARAHLRRLPVSTGDARFRDAQKNLATVAALVPAFPQQSRSYAEGVYLGRWGAAGDVAGLDAARAIGEALFRTTGESLLRDSVQTIDSATGDRRAQLAAAHALYDRGRAALARHQSQSAERDLRDAAARFERAASPMALVARYFAACGQFEDDDIAGSRGALEQLLRESDAHPAYAALRAQIDWQLATIAFADADWAGALDHLNDAEQHFRRLGERANFAFIRGMQSTALSCLGRPDEAWSARIEAFRVLDAEGTGDRLPVTLGGAARMELHAGRLDTAGAFLQIEIAAVRDLHDHAQLTNALVRETLLRVQRGDRAGAVESAREAMTAASSLSGPAREIALADARLANGAVELQRDSLTLAIDFYRRSQRMLFLPQAYLLRARAALRDNDREAALRDLDDGLDVLDRQDVLEVATALGQEAIRLHLEMGDVAGAFAEAERRNLVESPIAINALQRELRGTRTSVLMLAMLPGEAAAIAVTPVTIATAHAPLDERTLDARIHRATQGQREDAETLYDALVRPSEQALAGTDQLIVIADPQLREVPYAALYDRVTKRHLIEAMTIAVAENASSLHVGTGAPACPLAVAVALPAGDLEPLPDESRELADVTALYRETIKIEPDSATFEAFTHAASHARIVHVSGHTSLQRDVHERALAFAQHRATWRDLSAIRFDAAPVVILAACETLCGDEVRHTSGRSLGSGALAAGAADVIGTLAPIADRDAAELFHDIHRGLASGIDAAGALRRAQLTALASESATGRRSPWRAVALLTRHLPASERRT